MTDSYDAKVRAWNEAVRRELKKTDEVSAHDNRVRELYRTPKRALAAYYREHSGYVWSAVPPERWSKDQLVSDILRLDEETS